LIHYSVYYKSPHRHFLSFEARFQVEAREHIRLQLPAWRPGRYELGNFSKNIRGWKALDEDGKALNFQKINKDLWEVHCKGAKQVVVHYDYYAAELNAGSTYLDQDLLYINPVNCFFYDEEKMDTAFEIAFALPDNYRIACGLKAASRFVLRAENFDELADCPLIASSNFSQLTYEVGQTKFHICIQGEVNLNETKLINDFSQFTSELFKIFGTAPFNEYHFLFHFQPYFVRHGVEHSNSTVIAMGPAADFIHEPQYLDLLGISCHELFHAWNIKSIRPIEMMPYDFTKENYSKLGYVAEGVTTYYGDYLLWRGGAFTDEHWYNVLTDAIQTHLYNYGRFNQSVADSSFDTWLDGYGPGIPWRKVSIYNEGCLLAMICDLSIRKSTENKSSLDTVMKRLYDEFGKTGKGYGETDYRRLVEESAGTSLADIFDHLINGVEDYYPHLESALALVGLRIEVMPSLKFCEAYLGIECDENASKATIQKVVPDSPADMAGLWIGDEIIAVNDVGIYKDFQSLLRMQKDAAKLSIMRKTKLREIELKWTDQIWIKNFKVLPVTEISDDQKMFLNSWRSN
jgi:predicted metalloprotease with PDZ domain